MTTDRQPVASAFERREDAERALTDLRGAGFRDDDIGWAMRHEEAPGGTSDVADDIASGATAGALTGGTLGALGAAAGMALIPGLGPFLAGGYLGTILLTAGASAAAGGALGGIAGMFADQEEGKFYEDEFRAGRPIMTVNAGERDREAAEIFQRSGGYNYASRRGTTATHGGANGSTTAARTAEHGTTTNGSTAAERLGTTSRDRI